MSSRTAVGVACFTGHMIDQLGRRPPRFPASIESQVGERIGAALERMNAGVGYASAACGGDILFLESMLARGGEAHVVLPFLREQFIETSVAFAGQEWVERFESVLGRAASVRYASRDDYRGDDALFRLAADMVGGLALIDGQARGVSPLLLAALDFAGTLRLGGTMDTLGQWQRHHNPVEIIDLAAIRNAAPPEAHPPERMAGRRSPAAGAHRDLPVHAGVTRSIRTVICVHAAPGEARGRELDLAARLAAGTEDARVGRAESGEVCVLCDEADAAADLALAWLRAGRDTDAAATPRVRQLGLDTGPVYESGAPDEDGAPARCRGAAVERAARAATAAAPGTVCTSERTAALLAGAGRLQDLHHRKGHLDPGADRAEARLFTLAGAAGAASTIAARSP